MIVELVGLPGSGKTTLAEAMKKEGVVLVAMPSSARLVWDASLFWLSHPLLALRLLACIIRRSPSDERYALFVNGYLGYAARYRRARLLSRAGATAVLDQDFFQLAISIDTLPRALLRAFPKPDLLVVVEADTLTREKRMTTRGWAPREQLGAAGRLAWQEQVEAVFHAVVPSLEKLMRVYRYDGVQSPQDGAAALMAFAAEKTQAAAQVSAIRNAFKTCLALLSFFISRLARLYRRAPQAAALLYHSVDHSDWKLSVTPEEFERQMKYLARKGWTVPLADVVSYAKGEKKLPSHTVAITFDDGYRDLLTTVLPILERYCIPATVFVPGDLSAQTDPSGKPRLTERELHMLAQSPYIAIGSHAQTHQKFTGLSPEEMRSESEGSAGALARILGKRPRFFAYPFGARSADAERAVKGAGYEAAFGITEGMIHRGDDLFRLKRVQIDGTMNFLLFRLRLTGAVDWNRRIVDALRVMMPL